MTNLWRELPSGPNPPSHVYTVARARAAEIADFFLNYKKLEPKKWVKIRGWKDAKAAENMILSAIRLYEEKFEKPA